MISREPLVIAEKEQKGLTPVSPRNTMLAGGKRARSWAGVRPLDQKTAKAARGLKRQILSIQQRKDYQKRSAEDIGLYRSALLGLVETDGGPIRRMVRHVSSLLRLKKADPAPKKTFIAKRKRQGETELTWGERKRRRQAGAETKQLPLPSKQRKALAKADTQLLPTVKKTGPETRMATQSSIHVPRSTSQSKIARSKSERLPTSKLNPSERRDRAASLARFIAAGPTKPKVYKGQTKSGGEFFSTKNSGRMKRFAWRELRGPLLIDDLLEREVGHSIMSPTLKLAAMRGQEKKAVGVQKQIQNFETQRQKERRRGDPAKAAQMDKPSIQRTTPSSPALQQRSAGAGIARQMRVAAKQRLAQTRIAAAQPKKRALQVAWTLHREPLLHEFQSNFAPGTSILGAPKMKGATTTANLGLVTKGGEVFLGKKQLGLINRKFKTQEACYKWAGKSRKKQEKCDEVPVAVGGVQAGMAMLKRSKLGGI